MKRPHYKQLYVSEMNLRKQLEHRLDWWLTDGLPALASAGNRILRIKIKPAVKKGEKRVVVSREEYAALSIALLNGDPSLLPGKLFLEYEGVKIRWVSGHSTEPAIFDVTLKVAPVPDNQVALETTATGSNDKGRQDRLG